MRGLAPLVGCLAPGSRLPAPGSQLPAGTGGTLKPFLPPIHDIVPRRRGARQPREGGGWAGRSQEPSVAARSC